MDGFHLANQVLGALGLAARKGSPATFDAGGFQSLLRRLRAGTEEVVYAPEFVRELEEPMAGALAVPRDIPLVVVEGNYLLLDDGPWRGTPDLFDEVWYLRPPNASAANASSSTTSTTAAPPPPPSPGSPPTTTPTRRSSPRPRDGRTGGPGRGAGRRLTDGVQDGGPDAGLTGGVQDGAGARRVPALVMTRHASRPPPAALRGARPGTAHRGREAGSRRGGLRPRDGDPRCRTGHRPSP